MAEEAAAGAATTEVGTTETTPAATTATATTTAAATTAEAGSTQAATAAVVPEKYELKLPEGSTLDPAVLERTAATARELGLSQEHAQKISDLVAAEAAAREAALLEQNKPGGETWVKLESQWRSDALADPEIGGSEEKLAENVGHAEKVLGTFGSEPLNRFLQDTGFGSHPEVVRMFAKLGRAMGESKFVSGAPTTGNTEEAKLARLYPTMQAQG